MFPIELLSLSEVNAEIIDYAVAAGSGLAGRTVRDLHLPEGALVALISRDMFVIAPPATKPAVDLALAAEGRVDARGSDS